jgi:hypothetical protein
MRCFVVPTAVLALTLGLSSATRAGLVLVSTPADLNANDLVDWGQLGPDGTMSPSPTVVLSATGLAVTVATGDFTGLLRLDEGAGWLGNFLPGEMLLTNNTATYNPLTITFASPVSGAGANIQRDLNGPFTATISAYAGNLLLGTFTENGVSDTNEDGSAIFIGVKDTKCVITSVVFGLETADPPEPNSDFAINSLRISVVPEPGTLGPAGFAAVVGLGMAWRRRRVA